jgi:threonine dehydratase
MRQITLKDIFTAYSRIRDTIRETPFVEVESSALADDQKLFLKYEHRQITGSFKLRGALNKIASLSQEKRARGVIAASSGNHAQGVAYAAQLFHIPAKIVVPVSTPSNKINGTKRLGAEVVVAGKNYDESELIAIDMAEREDVPFIHAFNDPEVIAGQGTVALEMLLRHADLDQIVVPAGGGGLMTGIALCAKAVNPRIRVVGVQSEASPPWYYAMRAGHVVQVDYQETLADGLAGKIMDETFQITRRVVDDVVLVSEEAIADSLRWLMGRQQIVEGSGAVGIAAVRTGSVLLTGKTGVVISGGNIDLEQLQKILKPEIASDS